MVLDYLSEIGFDNKKKYWKELMEFFSKQKEIILYHGTSNVFKKKILKEGILSRKFTGNSVYEGRKIGYKNLESNSEMVYLGSFGTAIFLSGNPINKYGGDRILFRVLVNPNILFPDEDSKKKSGIESLISIGGSCVKDLIPPNKIIGYCEYKNKNKNFVDFKNIKTIIFNRKTYQSLI